MGNVKTTTQNFTQVKEVGGDVVFFTNRDACLIFELTATNFSLLSPLEQEAKIAAYASILNSLSFPIQILIRSKKLDIGNYLKLLEAETVKNQNTKLGVQIQKYRDFVANLIKVNTILDKKFFIIVPYNKLENPTARDQKLAAITSLHTKASTLSSQLGRLNLKFRILEEEELTKLYYDFYNESHVF